MLPPLFLFHCCLHLPHLFPLHRCLSPLIPLSPMLSVTAPPSPSSTLSAPSTPEASPVLTSAKNSCLKPLTVFDIYNNIIKQLLEPESLPLMVAFTFIVSISRTIHDWMFPKIAGLVISSFTNFFFQFRFFILICSWDFQLMHFLW